jgi:molybdopterin-guanine dinucleotide biosynthesis protein A
MIHRAAAPSIAQSIARRDLALIAALERAAPGPADLFLLTATPEQEPWFANLNTPEDLALAEAHLTALDPL